MSPWKDIKKWIEETDMTFYRKVMYIVSRLGFLLLIALTFLILLLKIDINWEEWSLFTNTKVPKSLYQAGFLTTVILLWELGTEGKTIRSIMNIKDTSTWQEKLIAAAFFGLLILAYTWCVAGGT